MRATAHIGRLVDESGSVTIGVRSPGLVLDDELFTSSQASKLASRLECHGVVALQVDARVANDEIAALLRLITEEVAGAGFELSMTKMPHIELQRADSGSGGGSISGSTGGRAERRRRQRTRRLASVWDAVLAELGSVGSQLGSPPESDSRSTSGSDSAQPAPAGRSVPAKERVIVLARERFDRRSALECDRSDNDRLARSREQLERAMCEAVSAALTASAADTDRQHVLGQVIELLELLPAEIANSVLDASITKLAGRSGDEVLLDQLLNALPSAIVQASIPRLRTTGLTLPDRAQRTLQKLAGDRIASGESKP
ncbi:MAG: hypothetical protein JSV80_09150 [Acidobacteriota bacterium]|nr:MAG: hypothetical protein JSV80_09150 [Acidobacteriota bacterium]